MLIDTHAHFRSALTPGECDGLVARAQAAGVAGILAVGCEPDANAAALGMAARFPGVVRAAVAYDRSLATAGKEVSEIARMIREAPEGHLVAIGEIGLDFHYEPETAEAQQRLMKQQLELARDTGLPVIIHSREADGATLDLLAEHAANWRGDRRRTGVLHCFTGSAEMARDLMDLGFMISFSGIVTFRNADALRQVARSIPAEWLLVETDSPYLTPVPHRGVPNEPGFLPATAAVLAKERGVAVDELAACTTANARHLFGCW